MRFRHEWKHEINFSDMIAIRQRLCAVAEMDENAIDGRYEIRSLYFDNLADKVLREKLDGINQREKFRLRYYNGNTNLIRLEKKSKRNGLETKEGVLLSRKEVQNLLEGDLGWMLDSGRDLVKELYTKMLSQGLAPKTIVDYVREPFVYSPGNVRVTLDYQIRTGLTWKDFLDPACVTIPAGGSGIILEVKWDDFLPSVIRDAIQLPGRRSAAFSKYAACRIYG